MALGLLAVVPDGRAEVFHSKESALRLAFPAAGRVETRTLFLTEAQRSAVEERAGSSLESRMVTCYVGKGHSGEVLGYAFLDTHVVRTLPETFMVVLDPAGAVRAVHILAFHEPTDYLPPPRWLRQFGGRRLGRSLALNQDIVGIAGSSLSSQAVTGGVRRILALYEVMIRR
ncbi:MAG: FMN-binding protein [Deltaproteobacteria bacterium]|nr:FMN-binding protein [Deltaproteobacteria bacterium]